ncbi:MAG: hypothetical protein QG580_236 [Patescibacteria group bacterium]|jgi:hypothetical protein|nr:hypothetical protein [Patescibacteria group bacterium]
MRKLFSLILVVISTTASLFAQMLPTADGGGYYLPPENQVERPIAPPVGVGYLKISVIDGGHIRSIFIPLDAVDADHFVLRPRIVGESSPRPMVVEVHRREDGYVIDPQYLPLFRYQGGVLLFGGKFVEAFDVYPSHKVYGP